MKINKILLIIAFLFVFLLPLSFSEEVDTEAAFEYYIQGYDYLFEGEYDDAIFCFKRAIEIDEEFVHAYGGLANAYAIKFETTKDMVWYDLTIEIIETAKTIDPYLYYLPEFGTALLVLYSANEDHDLSYEQFLILSDVYPEYAEMFTHEEKLFVDADVITDDTIIDSTKDESEEKVSSQIKKGLNYLLKIIIIILVIVIIIAIIVVLLIVFLLKKKKTSKKKGGKK